MQVYGSGTLQAALKNPCNCFLINPNWVSQVYFWFLYFLHCLNGKHAIICLLIQSTLNNTERGSLMIYYKVFEDL